MIVGWPWTWQSWAAVVSIAVAPWVGAPAVVAFVAFTAWDVIENTEFLNNVKEALDRALGKYKETRDELLKDPFDPKSPYRY